MGHAVHEILILIAYGQKPACEEHIEYTAGLAVIIHYIFVWAYLYFHALCMREANALAILRICADSSGHLMRRLDWTFASRRCNTYQILVFWTEQPQNYNHDMLWILWTCNGLAVFWPTMDLAEI